MFRRIKLDRKSLLPGEIVIVSRPIRPVRRTRRVVDVPDDIRPSPSFRFQFPFF